MPDERSIGGTGRGKATSSSERRRALMRMARHYAKRGLEGPGESLDESEEEDAAAAASMIVGEVIAAVSNSYSPDRSEFDSGLVGVREILTLIAANPEQSYFGYVSCRHAESQVLRDARNAATGVLAAMMERQAAYAVSQSQPPVTARAALGGVEALIRRELVAGRADRLPSLLPDIAYAATVPYMGQEEALRIARRGQALLEGRARDLR